MTTAALTLSLLALAAVLAPMQAEAAIPGPVTTSSRLPLSAPTILPPTAAHKHPISVELPDLATCVATPSEAARALLGGASPARSAGFRAKDLLVDPVLRKAWVRVADCQDSRKPLILVLMETTLAGAAFSGAAPFTAPTAQPPEIVSVLKPELALKRKQPIIMSGDTVEVLMHSDQVRMLLHGRALNTAASGEALDVVLDGNAESVQPAHRLRAVAIAPHQVEVQQ